MIVRLLTAITICMMPFHGSYAKTHIDSDLGYKIQIPLDRTICRPEHYTSDQGFTILWDTKKCPPTPGAASVVVYAAHNFAGNAGTTPELGKLISDGNAIRPSPFKVSGYRFWKCKPAVTDSDPINLKYFAVRHVKGDYPGTEPTYGITLRCPGGDCRPLMPLTRWLFAHMTFIRQE